MLEELVAMEEEAEVLKALEILSITTSDPVALSSSTANPVTLLDNPVGEFYVPDLTIEESEEELDMDDFDDSSSLC